MQEIYFTLFIFIFLGAIFVIIGNIINNRSALAKKLIDVDTLSGVPFGIPIAVRGKIVVDGIALIGPASGKNCIFYKSSFERYLEPPDGRAFNDLYWHQTAAETVDTIPFYISDDTGKLLINPEGAEIEGMHVSEKYFMPSDNTDFRSPLRVKESSLFVGETVNVYGYAFLEGNQKIMKHSRNFPLIITSKSSDQIAYSNGNQGRMIYQFGWVLIFITVIMSALLYIRVF